MVAMSKIPKEVVRDNGDEVLKKMLQTPHKPHVVKKKAAKKAKKK